MSQQSRRPARAPHGRRTTRPDASGGHPARVYLELRELLVRGELAPGSRLVETEIAVRLGVSRTPVRSALQRLQREGFLVSEGRAQSRLAVAPLTLEDARELLHILAELEGLAARRAAGLAPAPRRALAASLREVNAALERAARCPRPEARAVWQLDVEFHRRYVAAGGGARVLTLLEVTKPQAERYGWAYGSAVWTDFERSLAEHAAIAQAINAGDPDAAQHAVRLNWRNAAARLERVMREATND